MNIGFTGSRGGMTLRQKEGLELLLNTLDRSEITIHHGGCVGADTQCHYIAQDRGIEIVVHPPINKEFAADVISTGYTQPKPKHYHERDRDIVNECKFLIATPKSMEDRSGGTWYTINYARVTAKKPCFILEP